MTTTARAKTARNKPVSGPAAPADAIADRAFEYYAARGGEHGHDLEDWLRAERELTGGGTAAKKRSTTRKTTPKD
jgi:hypothetical protein